MSPRLCFQGLFPSACRLGEILQTPTLALEESKLMKLHLHWLLLVLHCYSLWASLVALKTSERERKVENVNESWLHPSWSEFYHWSEKFICHVFEWEKLGKIKENIFIAVFSNVSKAFLINIRSRCWRQCMFFLMLWSRATKYLKTIFEQLKANEHTIEA